MKGDTLQRAVARGNVRAKTAAKWVRGFEEYGRAALKEGPHRHVGGALHPCGHSAPSLHLPAQYCLRSPGICVGSAPARMSSAPRETTKKLEHVWMHVSPGDVVLLWEGCQEA